ncbi:MAG TPA: hypothetical protein VFO54_07720, partial [Chryseosolibacter sp.]|nr:hypothetical protein [Chryseosolibacter sp.]
MTSGIISNGQNLVPNHSFEHYKQLPCQLNAFLIQDLIHDWAQPLRTTTDYWSTLIDSTCFLNPSNVNAAPRTGNGMAGLITADIQMGNKIQYREYLEVKLLQPLTRGSFYHVEYYAKNTPVAQNINVLRSNNLGVAFTESEVMNLSRTNAPEHLLIKSAIKYREIADDKWNKVGGCFRADSTYLYLLIGNFEPLDSTKVMQLTFNSNNGVAYYFIDDVKVEKLPYDVSHLEEFITYCHEEPFIKLDAFTDGAQAYRWEDGSEQPSLVVSSRISADYTVNILFAQCSYKHVFHVRYLPPLDLGPDTLMCDDEVLVLRPIHPLSDFQWSDSSTDSVRNITATGTYRVRVLSDECPIEDTIEVEFIDCPGFSPNIITGNGDGL